MPEEYKPFNLNPSIIGGIDVNPATRPKVDLYGRTLTLAPIDSEELAIYNHQFPLLLAGPDSEERKIQLERQSVYMLGMRAIKYDLKGPAFRGLNPGDTELGFGRIRPLFVKGTSELTSWGIALTAATWVDFLYSSGDTGFSVGEDFGLIVTHLLSLVTPVPFVSEVHNKIGRIDLIPTNVRPIRVADNVNGVSIFPIPTMIIVPKETWWQELLADVTGTEELEQGGLVVGLGRVMKAGVTSWS